jgi:glycerol transport system substrate-binding protein
MDSLAEQMDDVLGRLERAGMQNCPPKLNPVKEAKSWFDAPGAPHPKLANEKPKGETVPYEQLLQAWKER